MIYLAIVSSVLQREASLFKRIAERSSQVFLSIVLQMAQVAGVHMNVLDLPMAIWSIIQLLLPEWPSTPFTIIIITIICLAFFISMIWANTFSGLEKEAPDAIGNLLTGTYKFQVLADSSIVVLATPVDSVKADLSNIVFTVVRDDIGHNWFLLIKNNLRHTGLERPVCFESRDRKSVV